MNPLVIDKYEIREEIKRGGFGVIYKGLDTQFGKDVAIKTVDAHLLGEAKYIDMFQREAISIAHLNHHNIVRIYDIQRDNSGQLYIIMEYIDGPDLMSLLKMCIKQNMVLPIHLGVHIVSEVCSGLDYAHNRKDQHSHEPLNLVHQDVSPMNIMLTKSGQVKLIDFGLATLAQRQGANSKEVKIQGKLHYLSPEQVNGKLEIDRRTDIFATGIVLYQLLTGQQLIKSNDPEEIIRTLRAGKWDMSLLQRENIPDKLRETLHKALAAKPADRYQSANLMYRDLMHYLILTAPASDYANELGAFVNELLQNQPDEPGHDEEDLTSKASEFGEIEPAQAGNGSLGFTFPGASEADTHAEAIDELSAAENYEEEQTSVGETESESLEHEMLLFDDSEDMLADEMLEGDRSAPAEQRQVDEWEQETEVIEMFDEEDENTPQPREVESPFNLNEEMVDEFSKKADHFKSVLPEPPSDPGGGSFYSFVEETTDDAQKTIIDVVRLSARTHKKPILIALMTIVFGAISFVAVDTFAQFTKVGTQIYDSLFPPRIKLTTWPSGADVYLDGRKLPQKTPLSLAEVAPGVHELTFVLPQFAPLKKSISVPGKGKVVLAGQQVDEENAYVFRFKTELEIASNPPGAEIIIDGVRTNQVTPATLFWDVDKEATNIELELAGLPVLTGLKIDAAENRFYVEDRRFWEAANTIDGKAHFKVNGTFRKHVTIESNPPGAQVFLDQSERPIGLTGGNSSMLLTMGTHSVTLKKGGYIPRDFSVEIDGESPLVVKRDLLRNVRIFAKDAASEFDNDLGARVVVKSRGGSQVYDGPTPAIIKLPPYSYTASFRHDGYRDVEVLIPSTETALVAKLQPSKTTVTIVTVDAITNSPVKSSEIKFRAEGSSSGGQLLGFTNEGGELAGEFTPGIYQVAISKEGYQAQVKSLRIGSTEDSYRLTFRLSSFR
jgi:serine/threonine protein kinase